MLVRLIGIGFAQAGATIATAFLVQFAFDRWVSPGTPGLGLSGIAVLLDFEPEQIYIQVKISE